MRTALSIGVSFGDFTLFGYIHSWSLFFSHSFGHPLTLVLGGGNSCPPSGFSMDVAFRVGIIPGVLLRVILECTLGAGMMLDFVVCVDDVCNLCSCLVSNVSVDVS